MKNTTQTTDANDLSLDVIRALSTVDVKALSYVQLRRLYSALIAATNDVDDEIASRSDTTTTLGETVQIQSPRNRTHES